MRALIKALTLAATAVVIVNNAVGAEVKTVQANGTTFEYVEQGTGTPVVFVHGAISDLRVWEGYRESISKQYRFISYTRRYFGKQPWADRGEKFTRRQHAEDLVAFIQAVSKEPVHLFTWSSGGNVGSHANVLRPDLIRSAVHFEPVLFSLAPEIPGIAAARREQFANIPTVFSALKQGNTAEAGLRFLEVVWDLPEGAADKVATPSTRQMIADNGRTIPVSFAAETMSSTTCEALARVQTPTLILVGAQSKPFFSMYAEQQGRCQANAVVAQVEGANHNGPLTQIELLTERALSFYGMFNKN